MKTLPQLLQEAVKQAAAQLFGQDIADSQIQFQKTRREFEGDVTLVVFPLVKISKMGPEQTGEAIGAFLKDTVEMVTGFNVVKGFLNIVVADQYWLDVLAHIAADPQFGHAAPNSKPRVLVEYSSPNTNKPLHLGHLRNIFLGYSVAEILKANGHAVSKVQVINDRGIHICKSMVAWKRFGNGETPESSGLKGDKLVGKYYVEFDKNYKAQQKELIAQGLSEKEAAEQAPIMLEAQDMLRAWEQKDPEVLALWNTMNGWVYAGFDASYKTMGVDFDKMYYESETYLLGREEVLKGVEKGIFYKKEDGSTWVDLTPDGLDEKVLLRKDGTAMYITQDIGTAILRFADFPDTAYQIYTVGNEQEYHFKVLFKILSKIGFKQADNCYHLSYGMVELPEGKMKSREGTVVDADDIMAAMKDEAAAVAAEQGKLEGLSEEEKQGLYHTIGMAALKYFLLRVDPVKNMLFNPKESIDFNGHTGPFVQYGYVRTRAIARKAGEVSGSASFQLNMSTHERQLIQKLADYPEVVSEAATKYNPSLVANYCFELVKDYNSFYQVAPIIREENQELRSFRLALTKEVGVTVKKGMKLLGIEVPEQM